MPPVLISPEALQQIKQLSLWETLSRLPEFLSKQDSHPEADSMAYSAITFLSNLGKMFPAFCYRDCASLRERFLWL